VIRDVLCVTLAGFALGAVFMAAGSRRLPPRVTRARWYKLAVFFLIIHAVLAAAAFGRPWILAVVGVILVAGAVELAGAWQRIATPKPVAIWPVFVIAGVASLWSAAVLPPPAFAFIFLAAAACDGFSQVTGQWLGRRPLAPRISPAKTVEGFLGGLCAAAAVAALVSGLAGVSPQRAAALGVVIGVAGLSGDLAASWVKRRAGIKDYSAALPGQGGFLDRFDSLLGALCLVAWLL
jgi:phosphatidate cytidylyltransferase